jgi:hypothetical protein
MTWQVVVVAVALGGLASAAVSSWLASDMHARGRARRVARRRALVPDPFELLELQARLGAIAGEIRRLQDAPDVYARAHHWRAAQTAYDALLRDACRLTGLSVHDAPLRLDARAADDERLREELELSAHGWSW